MSIARRAWIRHAVIVATTLLPSPSWADEASAVAMARTEVTPRELRDAVLHNPNMGWVLYENYPLDQNPQGSSTLLLLPNENFAGVGTVAIMFSWQDIEKRPDEYDFSKADFAYDYWAKRGKAIQLRLSAETLLWWNNSVPPTGRGVPDYVLERLALGEKQTRELEGASYTVVDARSSYYRERLAKFLHAVNEHFSARRPVTLIDLRGYGVWGEWHTGFKYANDAERHAALKSTIDLWCDAFPRHRLALSYSYDPDGPKTLYEGPTDKFDKASTSHYADYLHYSAFDHALAKSNVCFRRDGCGGAVHSNERKLNEEAFRLGRGPMFSEFVDGYAQSKVGGDKWLRWKIDDALSLHPNYVNLLGWQGADSLAFIRERQDLFNHALTRMGYRFVPNKVSYPATVTSHSPLKIDMEWKNRGVGRALRDYELRWTLLNKAGQRVGTASSGPLPTSTWVADRDYPVATSAMFKDVPAGDYQLALSLHDPKTNRVIELPLAEGLPGGLYPVGNLTMTADNLAPGSVE